MAKGFFIPARKKVQKKVETQKVGCVSCGLYTKCVTPKMNFGGLGEKKILIITDYTTKGEDQTGRHFANLSHKYMIEEFANLGIDVQKDCWKISAVRCVPSFNKKGEIAPIHINACRNKLLDTIKELKPEKIIVTGKIALQTLIGHRVTARMSVANYERWTGWAIPDQELKTMIYPIFNPAYVIGSLTERKKKMVKSGWYKDEAGPIWHHSKLSKTEDFLVRKLFYRKQIKNAIAPRRFQRLGYDKECSSILDVNEAITYLKQLKKEGNHLTFDYETDGLKPHRKGHKILTVSFSNGILACGMPFFNNVEFRQAFEDIMLDEKIGKIMHNAKYDLIWTKQLLGYWVKNVMFDPMLAAHVLDNRTGITSLKMQAYANFGYIYDNAVESFMTARPGEDEKNCNAFNMMDQAPLEDVCYYNAMDSHFTYKLWELQVSLLNEDKFLWRGFNLHLSATPVLAEIEQYGIKIDEKALLKRERKLEDMLIRIKQKMETCDEVKQWYEVKKEHFNFSSSQQLGEFLFKILKYTPSKFTDTGQPSTDTDSLAELVTKSKFVRYLAGYKKIEKVKNTFLAGIKRETVNGILHPGYNLNTVTSYRTSSSNPNFQNFPHHDKWSNMVIRSVFIPRDDCYIVELDYSSLEVGVNADYSHCKGLLKVLYDPKFDMHRESAADMYLKPADEITEDERQGAKGNLTFSAMYGSGFRLIANNFWNKVFKKAHKAHLTTKGIDSYDKFEQHCKKVLGIFQNERFKGQWEWRKKTWEKYTKTGEVVYKTGFKIRNLSPVNSLLNAPAQGSGSHLLIYGMIQLHELLKKSKTAANIIGTIHDSVLVEVKKDQLDKLLRMSKLCMIDRVRKEYPFEIVGLGLEADVYHKHWGEKPQVLKVAEREGDIDLSEII